MAYSAGLTGFIMVKVLAPGYYARQDTRTPVKIGVVAMLTNAVLCVALGFYLSHAGLALATSVAAFVNAGLLLRGLLRNGVYRPGPGWGLFGTRVIAACIAMGAYLAWAADDLQTWTGLTTAQRALELTGLIGVAMLIYVAVLWLVGLRPSHLVQPRAPL